MRTRSTLFLLPLITCLGACGGSSSPTGPSSPPPTTTPPGSTVTLVVYYDENANGVAEVGEVGRVPDVEVSLGSRSGRSEKGTGRAVVTGVASGSYTVSIRADTLPPFYAVGAGVTVQVPAGDGSLIYVPLRLPIGGNQPNQYMAFGDSITRGDGSSDGRGYPLRLQNKLQGHFATAVVRSRGAEATNSFEAVERFERNFSRDAYVLILYGTNDWNIPECQDAPPCHTIDNLRVVVREARAAGSLAFVATIIPANPAINAGRNTWVSTVNDGIKTMARQEGAFVVDLYQAFQQQGGDLSRFFSDSVHPNDAGYEVIANGFFEAIAHGRASPGTTSRGWSLFGFTAAFGPGGD
jgi:acyl-CoA thioesterase I